MTDAEKLQSLERDTLKRLSVARKRTIKCRKELHPDDPDTRQHRKLGHAIGIENALCNTLDLIQATIAHKGK